MNNLNEHSSSNLNKHQCKHPIATNRITAFSNKLIEMIVHVKHSRILSLGCGEGFDLKNIFEQGLIKPDYVCGMDLNHSSLRFSRKVITDLKFDIVNGDLQHLPIKLDTFDLILCLEVLEHLTHPEMALQEISRPFHGYCLFSVPNEPLYRLTRMLLLRKNLRQFGNHPEHLHNWSKRAFFRLISRYFIVDNISTIFPWTIILCHGR